MCLSGLPEGAACLCLGVGALCEEDDASLAVRVCRCMTILSCVLVGKIELSVERSNSVYWVNFRERIALYWLSVCESIVP